MTNFEKFGKDIIVGLIKKCDYGINAKNGEFIDCNSKYIEDCKRCVFNGECGEEEKIRNWLNAEYQEVDWSKVPIDTKVLVSNDNRNWYRRYFAYYRDRCILVFNNGTTSWTVNEFAETRSWKYVKLAEDEK